MAHPIHLEPLSEVDSALFAAVKLGKVGPVTFLLSSGANPNCREPLIGNTPLRLATGLNRFAVAKALLEVGADPNIGNDLDSTPLHVAVSALQDRDGETRPPDLRLARLLLDHGADPNARDFEGKGVLDFAAERQRVSALISRSLAQRLPAARGNTVPPKRL